MGLITIFTTLLLILKFLSIILLLLAYNSTKIKICLLLINMLFIYYLQTINIRRRKKLSSLRKWKYRLVTEYPIRTKIQSVWNIFILTIFSLFFILGIFLLRISNTTKEINLISTFEVISHILKTSSFINSLFGCLLIISFIYIYIKLILKIKNYIKFQYVRRHIFQASYYVESFFMKDSFISNFINPEKIKKYFFFSILYTIYGKVSVFSIFTLPTCKFICWFFTEKQLKIIQPYIFYFVRELEYKIHYIVVYLTLIYDLTHNNGIIKNLFMILPLIFIYDLSAKYTKFFEGINPEYDDILHGWLYEKTELFLGEYYIGPRNSVDVNTLKKVFKYWENGLHDPEKVESFSKKNPNKFVNNSISLILLTLITLYWVIPIL